MQPCKKNKKRTLECNKTVTIVNNISNILLNFVLVMRKNVQRHAIIVYQSNVYLLFIVRGRHMTIYLANNLV